MAKNIGDGLTVALIFLTALFLFVACNPPSAKGPSKEDLKRTVEEIHRDWLEKH